MTKQLNFFLPLLLLFFAIPAFSQFSLGIKAGVNRVDVKAPDLLPTVEEIPEFQAIWTKNLALVAAYEFSDNFALQSELTYTTKGFELDENFNVDLFNIPVPLGATAISRFDYLELPVLAKLQFGNDIVKGYALAGPTVGYALSGNLTTRARILVDIDLFDTDLDLDNLGYERLELGAVAGAGLSFNTGTGDLFLDARYHHGFTEVYDVPLLTDRVQNTGLSFNAGYLFHF